MANFIGQSQIDGSSALNAEGNQAVATGKAESAYSRLTYWEVWNFMSISHAKVEFDEHNIINLKGYNDSGKSAMMRALDVLMFNYKPSHQTDFIKDGEGYFRIIAGFDDGVLILRDKYANGQSLYEMYKDGECIFSTKQGELLTKVKEVPDCIVKYLGLIKYEDTMLNSRSCFDKQLLVQTSGSENYRFLNAVLKSEEIAVASNLINIDKNKLSSDMTAIDTELNVYKKQVEMARGINGSMIQALTDLDTDIDTKDRQLQEVETCRGVLDEFSSVPNIPEVGVIETTCLEMLSSAKSAFDELASVDVPPSIEIIPEERLTMLNSVSQLAEQLDSIQVPVEISEVSFERLNALLEMTGVMNEWEAEGAAISEAEKQAEAMNIEMRQLADQLSDAGHPQVICKHCGSMVDINSSEHVHS